MSEREKLVEVMAEAICDAMNMNRVGRLELDAATAALAALEAAGVRLMPAEATEEMLAHGEMDSTAGCHMDEIWRSMLAASPYAPPGG